MRPFYLRFFVFDFIVRYRISHDLDVRKYYLASHGSSLKAKYRCGHMYDVVNFNDVTLWRHEPQPTACEVVKFAFYVIN